MFALVIKYISSAKVFDEIARAPCFILCYLLDLEQGEGEK